MLKNGFQGVNINMKGKKSIKPKGKMQKSPKALPNHMPNKTSFLAALLLPYTK